jgi:hypothetical protein
MKTILYFSLPLSALCVFLMIMAPHGLVAQAPSILKQKCFGGTNADEFRKLLMLNDSTYLLGGFTFSADVDITNQHGGYDFWMVKTNADFDKMWSKCYGGMEDELWSCDIALVNENQYAFATCTESSDGDITNTHGNEDIWVARTDTAGNITWQYNYGGSSHDDILAISSKSNAIVGVGTTTSNNGTVSGNHSNSYDAWFFIIDTLHQLTQKCLGGSLSEVGSDILCLNDDGFFMAGEAQSSDFDLTANYGDGDFWAVKLDQNLNIQWQNNYGGSSMDWILSAQPTPDGGFILAGQTLSNDYDVNGNHGDFDIWVVKIDSIGNMQWQRCYGGSSTENLSKIITVSDGGYLIAAITWSSDGDITNNHGAIDCWIIKLDSAGNIVWQHCYGGTSGDLVYDILELPNKSILVAGAAGSTDGDVTGNIGLIDGWIVLLGSTGSTAVTEVVTYKPSLYPNPAQSNVTLTTTQHVVFHAVRITDMQGRTVLQQHLQQPTTQYILRYKHLAKRGVCSSSVQAPCPLEW